MYGPTILARFLTTPGEPDSNGVSWQYHSRSDRHSKVGCWGIAFDLLMNSSLLQSHAAQRKVILGINHPMQDYSTSRKKDLDLVLARPGSGSRTDNATFKELVAKWRIPLTAGEQTDLDRLPDIQVGHVGAVLLALEAKACMTAHVKARPRLYDELNSSHLCVHGASSQALAIGYVQLNIAEDFISSSNSRQMAAGAPPTVNHHDQPRVTKAVLEKVSEIPRRSGNTGNGFDAIGVSVFNIKNDGSPVSLVQAPPAPQVGDPFEYSGMIIRMANEYDSLFRGI